MIQWIEMIFHRKKICAILSSVKAISHYEVKNWHLNKWQWSVIYLNFHIIQIETQKQQESLQEILFLNLKGLKYLLHF